MCQCNKGNKTVPAPVPTFLQPLRKACPDFFKPAKVVTMERKHAVVPWAAEFWCTVTSPAFAMPLLLYAFVPAAHMPASVHLTIFMSVLTSIVSTLYHATLWKICGAADTSLAVVTFYSATLNLVGAIEGVHPAWRDIRVHLALMTVTGAIFVHHWRRTSWLAVKMFALAVPIAAWALAELGCYRTLAVSVCAIVCFLLDRFKCIPSHLAWHILGGLASMLSLMHSAVPIAA